MLLDSKYEYIIVGDVHGCIDELKTLLRRQGFAIDSKNLIQVTTLSEHKSIILLGDFIDKGSEEKLSETIKFIHKNYAHLNKERQRFYLIEGNHENMVYRYISNDSSIIVTPKTIANKEKYYNTVALLEKRPHLKQLFLELYDVCKPSFQYLYDETFSVTLTHAPCPEKYLREETEQARKKMIKCISRSKNPTMPLDELIPYTHEEAKDNEHYHVFGHLSQANIRQYKNKICIDTSAIYGNTLTCAIVKKNQLKFDSVVFENKQEMGKQTYNTLFNF
jgi:predicted phosphodiesterase